MNADSIPQRFQQAAEAWLCESYSVDTRFIAQSAAGSNCRILSASIGLNPLPHALDYSFSLSAGELFVGQLQSASVAKTKLESTIRGAIEGAIVIYGRELRLERNQPYDYYSEMSHRDRWFNDLHLRVTGDRVALPASLDSMVMDNALRCAVPPFDGLADLASWLGLIDPSVGREPPSITLRIGPPADLILQACQLLNNRLHLTVHAHPKLDIRTLAIAVRATPGIGLSARRQIGSEIRWSRVKDRRRVGQVSIDLENADQALAILMIGGAAVRRQWFIDSTKARNNRLVAVQQFDGDLRMIKRAVLEPSDPSKFELGVAALLFLLGFSPLVQLETDSPDVIVTTPGGRMALIECTLRIADFNAKVGKLVDRRGALSKALSASGHPSEIVAVLACALPRDQISASAADLRQDKIILLSREDLSSAFDRVRFPADPDQMLLTAQDDLARSPMDSGGEGRNLG